MSDAAARDASDSSATVRGQRLLAKLLANSGELILVLGRSGALRWSSPAVARRLGLASPDLSTRRLLSSVHRSHRADALRFARRFATGRATEGSITVPLHDAVGSWYWFEVDVTDLRDDPDVAGLLLVARDVDVRRTARTDRDAALEGIEVFVWEQDLVTRRIRWLSAPDSLSSFGALAHTHDEAAWLAAVHADDRERVLAEYARFERSGEVRFEVSFRLRMPATGEYRHVLERCHRAGNDPLSGAPLIRGVVIDVTEQTRIQQDLLRSRERFHVALECAVIGYYEWSVADDGIEGSSEWFDLLGLRDAHGRYRGSRLAAAMHPDDLADWQVSRNRHAAGLTPFAECHYRVRTPRGLWRWFFDRSQVVERDADGHPLRWAGIFMDVDASRRAELALGDAEARLGTAIWAAHIGLWELDVPSGRARWYSNWCEIEGIDPCEGPDHVALWDANIHPDDCAAAATAFSALLDNRHDQYESEYRVRTRSGQWLWIQERSRAVQRDRDGHPLRVVGTCLNIHARKLAEHELRDSQMRLQAIAMNSSDWLLLLDTDMRIVAANRAFRGIAPDRLIGRSAVDVSEPASRPAIAAFLESTLRSDGVCEMHEAVATAAGPARHFLIRAQSVRHEGRTVAIAVTATELTEMLRQRQLLELQARILETMREGVVLLDDRNHVRLTNPAFDRLFATAPGELLGRPIGSLLGGDGAGMRRAGAGLLRQLAVPNPNPVEFECTRADGTTFYASCVVTPVLIDGRDHWLAVLSDVSERKVLEREILEVSNREQHRIGNDLHDGLGQELTGVALMLRALATRIRREHPEALHEVDDIVELVNRSIESTRALARGLSPVSLERGGLIPALRTLAARSREAFAAAISLRTRLSQPLRIDAGAANHLYRIVQESINNAVRHGRASRITLQLTVDASLVRLSIRDNGRGLPPGGAPDNGLGLRTMHYRAHVVGGDLTVENHRHGGVIVRCVIPHALRDPQGPSAAEQRFARGTHA
jgi:PAS domain S-box-containing protein